MYFCVYCAHRLPRGEISEGEEKGGAAVKRERKEPPPRAAIWFGLIMIGTFSGVLIGPAVVGQFFHEYFSRTLGVVVAIHRPGVGVIEITGMGVFIGILLGVPIVTLLLMPLFLMLLRRS
jgi:hypothetical protein